VVDRGPLPIPQAEPFRFVGQVESLREETGRFSWTLPRAGATWGLRMAPQLLCVEAMAQAAAALNGLLAAGQGGPPEAGTLAKVDKVRFAGEVRPGDPLTIKVAIRRRFGDLVLLDGEVWVHHRMVAQAELVVRREAGS